LKGRPRTPTKILEMRGAFKANPQRLAQRENEPSDLPDLAWDAPADLSQSDRDSWGYLRPKQIPGVAKQSDEPAFRLLVSLWSKKIIGALLPPESKQIEALLGKFGGTPSERSKVSAGPKPKVNKFANIG
jgi:hypothetical protein